MGNQLTGYRKNSYGVAGMCVTNNPNTRKNTKVSFTSCGALRPTISKAFSSWSVALPCAAFSSTVSKQRVFNSVKDEFYKYNEMVHGRLYVIREMKLF